MANYEATKYDFTGANLTNIDLVNTGLIIPWTDGSVPSGFLECDGSAVSRSTYAALFAVIGLPMVQEMVLLLLMFLTYKMITLWVNHLIKL